MENLLKTFLFLIAVVSILIGFNAFSYQSYIFSDSLAHCCNLAQCESTNPNPRLGVKCHSNSGVQYLPICEDVTMTCYDCVDLTINNCLCYGGSYYCIRADGSFYYGTPGRECPDNPSK